MDSKSWGRVFREIREMKNLSLSHSNAFEAGFDDSSLLVDATG